MSIKRDLKLLYCNIVDDIIKEKYILVHTSYWKSHIGDLEKQITIYIQMIPFFIILRHFRIKSHTSCTTCG